MEITETGDQTSTKFTWNLLMVCGDPAQGDVTYFSGFPADQVSPISCPDNLAFDSVGNLWISTDGAPSGIGQADGLFKVTLDGAERGKVEQFLAVPARRRNLRPDHPRRRAHRFRLRAAPGRGRHLRRRRTRSSRTTLRQARRRHRGQARAPRPSVIQVFRG